jgi:hypothetical protein
MYIPFCGHLRRNRLNIYRSIEHTINIYPGGGGNLRDSVVGTVTTLHFDKRKAMFRIVAGAGGLSLKQSVQTCNVFHPASYSVGLGNLSLKVKLASQPISF